MVQFIQRSPGFGEQLGQGIARGVEHASDIASKMRVAEIKQQKERKDLGNTFGQILDEMINLKENVGPFNIAALNPFSETSGKRSQINTLRLSLEGLFRDLTLKGQFPKAIYERILKELPQASDTEEQYLNKIEGVKKIINSHLMGSEPKEKPHREEKFVKMRDPSGKLRKVSSKDINAAKEAGYRTVK